MVFQRFGIKLDFCKYQKVKKILNYMFNFFSGNNDIDCETFDNLVKEGYTVIDVRTKEEYVQARIMDCTQMDYYAADFKNKISEWRDKRVLVRYNGFLW